MQNPSSCRNLDLEGNDLDGDDRYYDADERHKSSPITIELHFSVSPLSRGKISLDMEGKAYPGASSGSQFGAYRPLDPDADINQLIQKEIDSQVRWFRAAYPNRRQILKIIRPGPRQTTLEA